MADHWLRPYKPTKEGFITRRRKRLVSRLPSIWVVPEALFLLAVIIPQLCWQLAKAWLDQRRVRKSLARMDAETGAERTDRIRRPEAYRGRD